MGLNRYAAAAIRELAEGGVTHLTPDEVIALHELGMAYEQLCACDGLRLTGRAVAVGGVVLWPQTLAGIDWWERLGGEFRTREEAIRAFAFSLARGRTPGGLEQQTRGEAWREIKQWARGVRCTLEELDEACAGVVASEAQGSRRGVAQALQSVVAALEEAGHGGPGPREGVAGLIGELKGALAGYLREPWRAPEPELDAGPYMGRWRVLCGRIVAACGGTIEEWWRCGLDEAMLAYEHSLILRSLAAGGEVQRGRETAAALLALRREVVEIAGRRRAGMLSRRHEGTKEEGVDTDSDAGGGK